MGLAASLYRALFGIDCAAAVVAVAFFAIGLVDGSVSSFNMGLWLGMLAAIAVVLLGGHALHRNGRTRLANLLLAVLALPSLVYVLFIAAVLILQPRWN